MKMLIWYGATIAAVGVAATMSGQSETPDDSSKSSGYIQTSKLVGRKVKSSGGKEIGVIKDIVIDRTSGYIAYTVVSTGGEGTGVSDGGGKIVAVPWAVYSPTSDPSVFTVNVDRDKIYNAPAFEYARMDEYARPDYIDNVYSYYGVSPGPKVAVAPSNGAKAGTDVTGTAGATASPGEVVSSAAAETGSANKKSLARTHASSAASPDRASDANPSPKATRSARAIGTRSTMDHDESPTTTEESASEETTSSSEHKKSRRKSNEETSAHRPRATPQADEGED
jgi:sporulation protein YlmC with PRC-barrel domain